MKSSVSNTILSTALIFLVVTSTAVNCQNSLGGEGANVRKTKKKDDPSRGRELGCASKNGANCQGAGNGDQKKEKGAQEMEKAKEKAPDGHTSPVGQQDNKKKENRKQGQGQQQQQGRLLRKFDNGAAAQHKYE